MAQRKTTVGHLVSASESNVEHGLDESECEDDESRCDNGSGITISDLSFKEKHMLQMHKKASMRLHVHVQSNDKENLSSSSISVIREDPGEHAQMEEIRLRLLEACDKERDF
jgi:hypothetical protein